MVRVSDPIIDRSSPGTKGFLSSFFLILLQHYSHQTFSLLSMIRETRLPLSYPPRRRLRLSSLQQQFQKQHPQANHRKCRLVEGY